MFDNRLLTRAMAQLGCMKLDKLAYSLPSSQSNLEWSVTFRLLGVYRWEIDGAVRCLHNEAAVFGRMCMREFAGNWWKNSLAKHPELGGGVGCPVANLAHWSAMHSLNIKDLTAEESAAQVTRDIQTYVLPFVSTIQSEQQYLELLLADEKPMRWHHGQPLQRFAESVWLCKRLQASLNPALAALERERALLQGQLFDLSLDTYAESVLQALPSEA
jgi:hypothetical protein